MTRDLAEQLLPKPWTFQEDEWCSFVNVGPDGSLHPELQDNSTRQIDVSFDDGFGCRVKEWTWRTRLPTLIREETKMQLGPAVALGMQWANEAQEELAAEHAAAKAANELQKDVTK